MAHEIDTTTGNAAVFVTGEPAWHRLGTVIETAATSAEAIQLAHLDWNVELRPLSYTIAGEFREAAGHFATVRDDTRACLGVVGRMYRPFQNAEAFDFMDSLVGDKLAMYETAGALKGGRRVWMLARIPTEYRIAGDDVVQPYVLLTNSHDGTQALRMIPTTVRVVCQNTLNLALRRAGTAGLSIVHTESLEQRILNARQNLGIIAERHAAFSTEAQALAGVQMSGSMTRDYFQSIFPTEGAGAKKSHGKIIDLVQANYENPRNTLPGIRYTAWAAYNAVSEWADHQKRVTGQSSAAQDDNRVNSIWFGAANNIKQEAWNAALALAS